MQEPLEDLPAVYRQLPIYYITNRFTVVGPGDDGALAALQPGDGLRARNRDRHAPHARRTFPPSEAAAHIFGYTIFNDFSARDRQTVEMQGRLGPAKGKSFDGANVLGPWIVTPDELGDPQTLEVEVRVNGETRAKGDTGDMLFSFAETLAYASQDETIHAGEVLRFRHGRQLLRTGDRPFSRKRRHDRASCRPDRRPAQQGRAPGRGLKRAGE